MSLTTMHERYAYPALVFLLVAAAGNRASPALAILWVVFAATFALNLVIAVPPGPDLVDRVPFVDALTVVGSAVMTVIAGLLVLLVRRGRADGPSTNPAPGIVGRWLAQPRPLGVPIAPTSWSGSPRSSPSACWSLSDSG